MDSSTETDLLSPEDFEEALRQGSRDREEAAEALRPRKGPGTSTLYK